MSVSPESLRLQMRGISKRYPGCLANDRIDLNIQPGEIHALLGENGQPDPENYRLDKLHLSDEGYAIWTEIIRTRLMRDLASETTPDPKPVLVQPPTRLYD